MFPEWRSKRMNTAMFKYTVRHSLRARCIRLHVTQQSGLEIVVPLGYPKSGILQILERKQRWIRSALGRVEEYRRSVPAPSTWQAPDRIVFPAIGREWRIETHPENTLVVKVSEDAQGILHIRGCVSQANACRAALQRWWLRQGYLHLPALLEDLGRKTGTSFTRVSVRRQRTRWGSCSRRKAISLNAKLLFLEPAVAHYVMIHELCHTREMNHRSVFWDLVRSACPDYRALNKSLRQAWNTVPEWAR